MADSWRWVGDGAVMRRFEGNARDANARALNAWRAIAGHELYEAVDVIPAARSVTVALRHGMEPSPRLRELMNAEYEATPPEGAAHTIAVTYDGDDLADVAMLHSMTTREVIREHTGAIYTVAFVGFSPGFAYLMGLSPRLHTARLDSPRTRVPAGSIGIGGAWTGIYPSESPGGWRLIGRVDVPLFDTARGALLQPGDRVRFVEA